MTRCKDHMPSSALGKPSPSYVLFSYHSWLVSQHQTLHALLTMWHPRAVHLILPVIALAPSILAFKPASTAGTDALALVAKCNVEEYKDNSSQQCSKTGPSIRKEWTSLCAEEQKQYIDAVLCMMSLPSISGDLAPGARNRYDDFLVGFYLLTAPSSIDISEQATHINQTLSIHGTGNFLFWHRFVT